VKISLPLKLGIIVVLVFSVAIAGCLLWTPIWIKYYVSKYRSEDVHQISDGIKGLLSLGENGTGKLEQLTIDVMQHAPTKRKIAVVDILVANGSKGTEILSCVFGSWPEAEFLQENWGKNNNPDKEDEWSLYPLHKAAHDGYINATTLLLSKGANSNVRDTFGRTPLLYALDWSREDIALLLIENGANVNVKDSAGWTALHEASRNGCKNSVLLLIERNANVNSKDNEGTTPLHQATIYNNQDCAEILIRNNADLEAKNKDGETPLSCAVFFQCKNIVALLIEKGADLNVKDNNGNTPLDSLVRDAEIISLLRSHGAKTGKELRKETRE